MEQHSVLKAKIKELEEASLEAAQRGDPEKVKFYTAELLPLIIRLVDAIRTSESDS